MRFKFKPQTAMLIGGLLAVSYSEACWYSGTKATCYVSGDQVDTITWADNGTTSAVTAQGDFTYSAPPGHQIAYQGTGSGGHVSLSNILNIVPTPHCIGAASFLDRASHSTSLTWENANLDGGFYPLLYEDGGPSGATCNM